MKVPKFLSACLLLLFLCQPVWAQPANKLLIAAAADLRFALDSVIASFNQANTLKIDVSYGSSGRLFTQISNGAPFDIFFSADISYPKQLQERGLTRSDIYLYGIGRIVLWSRRIDPRKEGIQSVLDPSVKKIAIANPMHAPYGKRAEEALQYHGLLDKVRDKFVYGENIAQTAQFVTSGAADIGIVALSLALAPNMKREGGQYYLIPDTFHQPLEQGVVIVRQRREKEAATVFMDFLKSDKASEILAYFGFTKP